MNNLKNLRSKRELSIKALSNLTGIPSRTLEDWESEKRQIRDYHRMKFLAKFFGVTVDELMMKEEKCVYDGNNAITTLIQEADGVHITISSCDENQRTLYLVTIEREKALALLKYLKNNAEVKPFFDELKLV